MNARAITTYKKIRAALAANARDISGSDLATLAGVSPASVSKFRPVIEHLEPTVAASGLVDTFATPALRPGKLLAVDLDNYTATPPFTNGSSSPAPTTPPTPAIPECPKCGGPMVRRVARKGPKAGTPFFGCTTFPHCQGVRAVSDAPKTAGEHADHVQTAAKASPAPSEPSAPTPAPGNELDALKAAFQALVGTPKLDSEEIARMVAEEVAKQGRNQISITIGEKVEVFSTVGKHSAFVDALEILSTTGLLWLAGKSGTGKTTLGKQLAEALELPFYSYSCTAGMSEGQLMGRLLPDGSYAKAAFTDAYENGGVVLMDEIDGADPNVTICLNSALANDFMSVPNRVDNPMAKRHPDFFCIVGSNTFGQGADDSYVGREAIDAATIDRFRTAILALDYDRNIELGIEELGEWAPIHSEPEWWTAAKKFSMTPGAVLEQIRHNIETFRIPNRLLSTRTKVDTAKQLKGGRSLEKILESFFAGWNKADVEQALTGVK